MPTTPQTTTEQPTIPADVQSAHTRLTALSGDERPLISAHYFPGKRIEWGCQAFIGKLIVTGDGGNTPDEAVDGWIAAVKRKQADNARINELLNVTERAPVLVAANGEEQEQMDFD